MHPHHFFSSDRGIVVASAFFLWIGAAGLICWALVPKQLPEDQPAITNPAAIVHLESTRIPTPAAAQISIAQR
jgi:hypothetical protein